MAIKRQGLPWNQEPGERKRLFGAAFAVAPFFLAVAVYVSWVELPEKDRAEQEALPPQLAKFIKEREVPPPPPPPEIKEPEPQPEPEPEEPKVAEPEPKPEPKPVILPEPEPEPEPQIAEAPEPPKPTEQEVQQAREKASQSGILAMGNELSKIAALGNSVDLGTPETITAEPIARTTEDALATRAAAGRSAGVDDSQLARETREVALAERQQKQVEQQEQIVAAAQQQEQQERQIAAARSKESLTRTMDANKAAIRSIYNRERRKKPSLQGTVTPVLVIDETGSVASCNIEQSTLNEPTLEQKICNRLRLVNFGEKPGVEATTFRYSFNLLPG